MRSAHVFRGLVATLLLSLTVLISACGGTAITPGVPAKQPAAPAQPVATAQPVELAKVKLARLAPSALLWLHAIAVDQKLYEKHGVQVEDVQVQSSPALVQAVASGSADAGVGLGDNVMQAIDQGAPIVITGAILHKPILRFIGKADTVQALKGTKVTAGAVEGGTTDLMLYLLKKGGLAPTDVQVVALTNSSDRLVAMQKGDLAGALLIAPFDVQALKEGAKLLDVYDGYWLQTPLIVNKTWAAKNPKAASGLTQAFSEAAAWIYKPENRAAAVSVLAAYTGISADVVDEAYKVIVVNLKAISPDLTVPDESLKSILTIKQAVHGGNLPQFDVNRYYDPSYLKGK
jgi:ABC-type nitrate/sulfonate/bicarbonate transport system substrate-binding protein